ncbi:hypothetical protein M6B22_06890 [Jatrophihabitans cynanchi]|uniref:Acetolactate synthase small subunit C-terminal domain-containing protein n=1 Tax=Jatrophihabitans cynanchi TaxID=2944128 RepID=A0ABY7K574_9ACTN|nr:ACT domain-containing protein [Jatrophihabitans sp. SB3-54]WAX58484.1 hypothetical protein M6B22_06890 [Jatrophihabitans sp. SB3-54]
MRVTLAPAAEPCRHSRYAASYRRIALNVQTHASCRFAGPPVRGGDWAMTERLLLVETTGSDEVPARITRLLAQRRVRLASAYVTRRTDDDGWAVQLVVDVTGDDEVSLLVKRLNRLIDVVRVIAAGTAAVHQRRSVFVTLQPDPDDASAVDELVGLFGAEVLDVRPAGMTLHLAADPRHCEHFVAVLEPYTIVETVAGAVCAIRHRRPSARPAAPRLRAADAPVKHDRLNA